LKDHVHQQTPLIRSTPLSSLLKRPVWLKLEAVQPGGSFKIRGIGRLCQWLYDQGVRHVISSSGGNAGLAAACAATMLSIRATVVVPRTTPAWVADKITAEGADVIVHGAVWDEADHLAKDMAKQARCGYVSPFDHPQIWAGHATLIDELAKQFASCALDEPRPEAIVVAVGGGGLLCGVLTGIERVGWTDSSVIAVETEGAASFAAAYEAGHLVTLDAITSVARSLGAKRVTAEALKLSARHTVIPTLVSDAEAIDACYRFVDEQRLLVEPACGAALAACYQRRLPRSDGPVVVVVCGGSGVSLAQLHDWKRGL
jgi:L-serine/L-threonine ammonia-lyase